MGLSITTLGILFTIISAIFILLGSFKLFKTKNIPGSKLIFFSVISAILTIFIPDPELMEGKNQLILLGAESIVISLLMLAGAYGFFLLANFTASNNANKAIKTDG